MGYRVDYGPMNRAFRSNYRRFLGWQAYGALFFLCFVIAVCCFWPEGQGVLRQILFPGDWQALEEGVLAFQESVKAGEPGLSCAEAFCRVIIGEGGLAVG